jgi:hypothetical protein
LQVDEEFIARYQLSYGFTEESRRTPAEILKEEQEAAAKREEERLAKKRPAGVKVINLNPDENGAPCGLILAESYIHRGRITLTSRDKLRYIIIRVATFGLPKNRRLYIGSIGSGWGVYKPYGTPELKNRSLRVKTGEVATVIIIPYHDTAFVYYLCIRELSGIT